MPTSQKSEGDTGGLHVPKMLSYIASYYLNRQINKEEGNLFKKPDNFLHLVEI